VSPRYEQKPAELLPRVSPFSASGFGLRRPVIPAAARSQCAMVSAVVEASTRALDAIGVGSQIEDPRVLARFHRGTDEFAIEISF